MTASNLFFLLILSAGVLSAVVFKKLNISGALVGGIVALLIFMGAGYTGIAMLGAFFILGSTATGWKLGSKEESGLQENNDGKRTAKQVVSNGGIAALCGLLSFLFPGKAQVFQVLMSASLASAAADTLSSEMGNIYGSKFYNILTFRKDQRGLDGVVSLEGSLFGLLGAAIIATIYGLACKSFDSALVIFVSGTIGNISDSLLGAAFQRRKYLTNDSVNLLNTLIASVSAAFIIVVWKF